MYFGQLPPDTPPPETDTEEPQRLAGFDYWFGQLAALGLSSPQAELLADKPDVDRHRVREALLAAQARGTLGDDADFIFDCFS